VATLRVRNGPDGAEKRDFRSSPNNGYCQTGSVGPVRAMKRLMRRSTFAEAHPETIDVVLDTARDVYAEAAKDIRDTAKTFSAAAGFPEPVMELALSPQDLRHPADQQLGHRRTAEDPLQGRRTHSRSDQRVGCGAQVAEPRPLLPSALLRRAGCIERCPLEGGRKTFAGTEFFLG
jgi:hypothetical protein